MNRLCPVRRSLFATLAGGLLLGCASAGLAADRQKAAPPVKRLPAKVDHNKNKLLDDLESRLAAKPAAGTVNVIVTLKADPTRERVAARQSVPRTAEARNVRNRVK